MRRSLIYKHSIVGYTCTGTGQRTLIAFHGYGEDAGVYDFLAHYIGEQFTIYSLDLPYHGETIWDENDAFTKQDLLVIVKNMLAGDGRTLDGSKPSTITGFSLGGRIALTLYESDPTSFDRLVLMAPDGLKVNFWYWLSTQTLLGNRFFAFTMKHPQWFFGFLRVLNKLKLVNASIFKFVNFYIGSSKVRELLYKRWTTLRKIKPNLTTIRAMIKKGSTRVELLYGRHDRIILASVGEKFRKGIETQSALSIIESGHQVLHEKHADAISACLNRKS